MLEMYLLLQNLAQYVIVIRMIRMVFHQRPADAGKSLPDRNFIIE
ncbi:hypothetical protein GGI1_18279 [Acidithiobacillus sp. GGI-221]|nr:hypothetical protein GGI1_18279 [Acidithiobacillus sp. GGI-221]